MSEPLTEGSDASPPARHGVRIPIWLKILAALVVPLVVVAGLAYLQVQQANDRVAEVDDETALASVAVSPGGLVDALIVERGDAIVTMLGIRETATFPTASFDESMSQTDTAVSTLQEAVADGGEAAQEAFADALNILDVDLANTRDTVATATENAGLQQWDQSGAAYDSYTQVIDALNAANASLVSGITDPQLRAAGETLDDVNAAHDAVSNLSLFIGRSMLAREGDLSARDNVAVSLSEYADARDSLSSRTTGPWAEPVRAYQSFFNYNEIELQAQAFLDNDPEFDLTEFIGLNPAVTDRGEAEMGTTQRIAQDATAALTTQIDTLRNDARTEQRNYTILAIAVVLGAALLAALMARSVTRPLRRLTEQADEMASVRLPAAVKQVLETPPGQDVVIPDLPPLTVRSHDEVQAVAGALNKVQTSALDLAVEQATLRRNIADSFVSLGRRTQNLIGLQLEQITRLEEDEADPTVLESLYRLDHLATRARRNAESLVVLGGTEAKRTGGAPIRMTDIVRASLSEVEDYQRVELVQIDEVTVPAWSAADLIHLLAEITENGLSFSPPTSSVDVRGQRTDDGYRITVEDRGVGMTDEKIREANVRLAGQESFTVAPSRYLGHYVAGRLAARVGASASLRRNSTGGIVAVVDVPNSLLLEASVAPATAPATESSSATATGTADDQAPLAPVAPISAKQEERSRTSSSAGTGVTFVSDDLDGFKIDGRPPEAPQPGTTTATGLRKRVPGQHVKPGQIAGPTIPRNDPSATPPPAATASAPGAPATPTSANLAGLLTAYNSGVERGREDAPNEAMPEIPGTNGSNGTNGSHDPNGANGSNGADAEGAHTSNGEGGPDHDHDHASDDHEIGPDDPRRDALDREHAP